MVPIDKLSILVTIGFSYVVFHEKLSAKSAWGLGLITAGTLMMVRESLVWYIVLAIGGGLLMLGRRMLRKQSA